MEGGTKEGSEGGREGGRGERGERWRVQKGYASEVSSCTGRHGEEQLTLSRPVLQMCNNKFNYLQLIIFKTVFVPQRTNVAQHLVLIQCVGVAIYVGVAVLQHRTAKALPVAVFRTDITYSDCLLIHHRYQ